MKDISVVSGIQWLSRKHERLLLLLLFFGYFVVVVPLFDTRSHLAQAVSKDGTELLTLVLYLPNTGIAGVNHHFQLPVTHFMKTVPGSLEGSCDHNTDYTDYRMECL